MHVNVTRAELARILATVSRMAESGATIPILSHVRLEAKDGILAARGTNLDQETTAAAEANVEVPGAICLPAKILTGIAAKLPKDASVAIEVSDSGATVKAGRSRFKLQTRPATDYPDLAAGAFTTTFTLTSDQIKLLFGKTQFAISTEETRYYLNGVYLHLVGDSLVAVATDGHRLARVSIDAPVEALEPVIIPRAAVAEILRLAAGGDLKIELSPTKVRATTGDVVFTSKLIDGTFPDYQRIIPQGSDKALVVDKRALATALSRVGTVASEKGRAVKLAMSPGSIVLSVHSNGDTAEDEIPAEFNSEPFEVGLNGRYLGDILSNATGDTITARFGEVGTPVLFGALPELFVCMPMRV